MVPFLRVRLRSSGKPVQEHVSESYLFQGFNCVPVYSYLVGGSQLEKHFAADGEPHLTSNVAYRTMFAALGQKGTAAIRELRNVVWAGDV
jgi:hypothetical protein